MTNKEHEAKGRDTQIVKFDGKQRRIILHNGGMERESLDKQEDREHAAKQGQVNG